MPDTNTYREFYSTSTRRIPKGYYKGIRTITDFQITNWNLFRKYGKNWKSEATDLAKLRLKSWGMNNIGSFSNPNIIKKVKIPYTAFLGTGRALRIEGSEGPWYKFPDPFDVSFKNALQNSFKGQAEAANDPYLVGYFVDNEFHWGDNSYLGKAVIQSGKNQPAKKIMRKYLEKKYKTIGNLNFKWQTSYKSWDDFMQSTSLPIPEPPLVFGSSTKNTSELVSKTKLNNMKSYIEDTKVFSSIVANEYYKVIKEFLEKSAPNKLYLGSKFDFVYYPNQDTTGSWIVKLSAKYCDVIPFDRYSYTNSDFIPVDIDKPFIIGEWGMGAVDRGLLHYGLRFADNQENRAEMYYNYVKSSLLNPFIVGVQWFKYYDQPVTGRTDGEDYNMGFLDVCDTPYPEMVSASRKIGNSMYEIRYSK